MSKPAGAPGPDTRVVVALDVGGTKLEAGVVDDRGRILERRRCPTPADDAGALDRAIGDLVDEAVADAHRHADGGAVAVGVGSGGPMRPGPDGSPLVTPLNIPAWRDHPLGPWIHERTGLPVHVDNDAKALALAEAWVGAGAGERDLIAMVVSTGVGGGIVLGGRLLDGAAGNAGHIGHVVVEPGGRRCGCGGRGCLEAEASGTAIAALTGRPAAEATADVRERTGRLVGMAVASVANLLDLRLALVAGSVALGFGDDFFRAAQAELDARARLDFSRGARIRPAGLGPDGPLVGAAAVAWRAAGLPGPPG